MLSGRNESTSVFLDAELRYFTVFLSSSDIFREQLAKELQLAEAETRKHDENARKYESLRQENVSSETFRLLRDAAGFRSMYVLCHQCSSRFVIVAALRAVIIGKSDRCLAQCTAVYVG